MTIPDRVAQWSAVERGLPPWAGAEPELYTAPTGAHEPVPPRRSRHQQTDGRIHDRIQFAEGWARELRSGRRKQARGGWDTRAAQCVNKVAIDAFGVTLGDLRDAYGSTTINDLFYRNDIEGQSFSEIAGFMNRTIAQGRPVELER